MKASPPAQSKHATPWEGGDIPSLRLVGEKPSVLSQTFVNTSLPSIGRVPPSAGEGSRSWIVRHLLVLACVAAFSLPAYFLASRFIVTAVVIQGRSMTPTLKDGERYYLN